MSVWNSEHEAMDFTLLVAQKQTILLAEKARKPSLVIHENIGGFPPCHLSHENKGLYLVIPEDGLVFRGFPMRANAVLGRWSACRQGDAAAPAWTLRRRGGFAAECVPVRARPRDVWRPGYL
ncbi:MAG: hypothetical protein LBD06_13345 [Candidatus Accumulibacter sp.]|jgi:hypothetical protein|nr:hypothetical protein [Accumulibacter sp.]